MNTISVEGQQVHYRAQGAGPVVILLHCSSSHSGQWAPLIDLLSPNFNVLAPDLHGYGRSDPLPLDGRAYFERDGAIVTQLAAKYGPKVHIVGHSLGGTVALHTAVKHPDILNSLTVIEPVQFSLIEEAGIVSQAEYHEISSTVCGLVRLNKPRDAARLFVDFWASQGAYERMDAKTQAYVEQTIERVTDDWAGCSRHAPGQITIADLAGISVPSMILRGSETRTSARNITEIVHKEIAGSDLVELPGLSHMAAANQPGAINEVIVDFLNAQTH
ncbi:MAG: alpha/beta hydrolase [Marinosulfonomonas sp.]|nr:alpha/beta hydrolase [Marinosulfonomonas sp.]